jgi:hypothetical protein
MFEIFVLGITINICCGAWSSLNQAAGGCDWEFLKKLYAL